MGTTGLTARPRNLQWPGGLSRDLQHGRPSTAREWKNIIDSEIVLGTFFAVLLHFMLNFGNVFLI